METPISLHAGFFASKTLLCWTIPRHPSIIFACFDAHLVREFRRQLCLMAAEGNCQSSIVWGISCESCGPLLGHFISGWRQYDMMVSAINWWVGDDALLCDYKMLQKSPAGKESEGNMSMSHFILLFSATILVIVYLSFGWSQSNGIRSLEIYMMHVFLTTCLLHLAHPSSPQK